MKSMILVFTIMMGSLMVSPIDSSATQSVKAQTEAFLEKGKKPKYKSAHKNKRRSKTCLKKAGCSAKKDNFVKRMFRKKAKCPNKSL